MVGSWNLSNLTILLAPLFIVAGIANGRLLVNRYIQMCLIDPDIDFQRDAVLAPCIQSDKKQQWNINGKGLIAN